MVLVIFGIRKIRIGHYLDTEYLCYRCNSYEHEISVYRSYFHFCFIPVFPVGHKLIQVRCRNCGDETQLESVIKKYESRARTPFYFYSAIIIAVCLTSFWVYWKKNGEQHNAEWIKQPAIGDVYTVKEEDGGGAKYYFLRVAAIKGDSISLMPSHLEYNGFVSDLSTEDYFQKSAAFNYSREQMVRMFSRGEIHTIDRNYRRGSRFNQVQ